MNFLHKRLQRAASPAGFERLSARVLPWLAPLAWALLALGTVWGLAFAPMDYQQKNSFRIIYVHVPAAMLSMSIYVMLAVASLVFFCLAQPHRRVFCPRRRALWRADDRRRPRHRRDLGQANLGHVLDVGRASDFRADSAFFVSRLYVVAGEY